MEKGELRCEVNVSLAEKGAKELGTKVEIKNLNSMRAVEKAIKYETERQSTALEAGKKVVQETRGWHDKKEITFSQRSKEEAHDYRYFPEPDLPPLNIANDLVKEISSQIPELPRQKRERFKEQFGLPEKEIKLYVVQKDLGEYYEKVVSELNNWLAAKKPELTKKPEQMQHIIKLASNYIATDLQGLLKGKTFEEKEFSITPENFALIKLI